MTDHAPSPFDRVEVEDHFRQLPGAFYTSMPAERVGEDPVLLHASPSALALLGLDGAAMTGPGFLPTFAGHSQVPGFAPFAMAYAGHQFGHYVPQLGDGRALTIAQVRDGAGGLWDVQLKGAGRTPYSRFGDGRAVMRSVLREYLCSEHMAALGIPTTRAGTVIATREGIQRETIEPGAIMSRIARSHIRFGHFEYVAHQDQPEQVKALADHVIDTYAPQCRAAPNPYEAWFRAVVARTADLMAAWQAVGFAHGVMNTDNMSILGLTIDYGPFGFLDAYDPGFICNHTDQGGRYAFARQPSVGLWNLQALGAALTSLLPKEALTDALNEYAPRFEAKARAAMVAKMGISGDQAGDTALLTDLLTAMRTGRADYTATFRQLSRLCAGQNQERESMSDPTDWLALFEAEAQPLIRPWVKRYQARLAADPDPGRPARMDQINPKYVLRNWVAETAIRAVEDKGDIQTLDTIFGLVTAPFEEHPGHEHFAAPPPADMADLEVSCSS